MKNIFKKNNSQGFAGIIALLTACSLVLILTFSLSASLFTKKQISRNLSNSLKSYYLAESGTEDAIVRVLKNYNYSPTNTFILDGATIDQDISESGNTTTIDVSSSYLNNVRKLTSSLTITTTEVSFYYGVQVGEGGLSMGNSGTSVIGNIYSNGTVTGNSSVIAGDVIVATGMEVDPQGVWANETDDGDFGKISPLIDIAISFTPTSTEKLNQVSFNLKKTGSSSGGTIRIMTDNSGVPSTTQLASTPLGLVSVGNFYAWAHYTFSSAATLTAGNTYWIVIDVAAGDASNYLSIRRSPGNANSVSAYSANYSGGSWTLDASGDYNFKAWMGGDPTYLNDIIVKGSARANRIINSFVCGDAYYKNIDASSLSFLNNPTTPTCSLPLTNGMANPNSDDSPIEEMPVTIDTIRSWEAEAEAGGVYSDAAHCNPPSDISIGPAKLNCNFTGSNGIKITLNGTLWVNGNITLPNNAIVELSSGYGGNSGVIIADNLGNETASGIITTSNNAIICGSNGYNSGSGTCNASNDTYIMFLSTHSGAINAINISNNASGAIFYAFAGIANVSNNANVKEVTAYKLVLENNTAVTYESGLANAAFSSGPGGGWEINSWYETE